MRMNVMVYDTFGELPVIICGDLNSRTGVMNGKYRQLTDEDECADSVEESCVRRASTVGIYF